MKLPLFDFDFLVKLFEKRDREIFARITSLTKDELPIEYIEGKVTGGSINVDGNSVVRRTCSLSMVAEDVNINDYLWGLKNKFKLEIGLANTIDDQYPEIIWFKQGLYVITSFSTSQNTNSYNISISGKDKMCLLNGDLAGVLPHETDFAQEETVDKDGYITSIRRIPIAEIIRNVVMIFGGELPHKIIIKDVENNGFDLLEYRGDTPLYIFNNTEQDSILNMTPMSSQTIWVQGYEKSMSIAEAEKLEGWTYDKLSEGLLDGTAEATKVSLSKPNAEQKFPYTISKLEYGMDVGYRQVELVYAGELIGDVGTTLTAILDKIKNMLGEFEYFYDVDGNFVFQKKPIYVSAPWGMEDERIVEDTASSWGDVEYSFINGGLMASFSNNPNIQNLRNDFAVWGKRENDIPIHMRYAIDIKPTEYVAFRDCLSLWLNELKDKKGNILNINPNYYDPSNLTPKEKEELINNLYNVGLIEEKSEKAFKKYLPAKYSVADGWDWRELIYQMALDYRKWFLNSDDFTYYLRHFNPQYQDGKTGYEQYYIDLEGFWRLLYQPEQQYDIVYRNEFADEPTEDFKSSLEIAVLEKVSEVDPAAINSYYIYDEGEVVDGKTLYAGYYPFLESRFCAPGSTATQGWLYYASESSSIGYKKLEDDDIYLKLNLTSLYVLENGEYIRFVDQMLTANENNIYIIPEEYNWMPANSNNLPSGYSDLPANFDQWKVNRDKTFEAEIIDRLAVEYRIPSEEYNHNDETKNYWSKTITDSPESLLFWFDFLDAESSELGKYSVPAVGIRSKAIKDESVKVIHYRDIPKVIYGNKEMFARMQDNEPGYVRINLTTTMENLFSISSRGYSAKEKIDDLLYQHGCCVDSVSISAVPVYNLDCNSHIQIKDEDSGTNGRYIVNRITYPLNYNGMMSITATKAITNIV